MNKTQMAAAQQAMIVWLTHIEELGKAPFKIECVNEFELYDLHYYVFRFKKNMFGSWLLGICGGYETDELEHCGHIFSNMEKYKEDTAIEVSKIIVEEIRTYWIQKAEEQEEVQALFEKNLKYISQTEIKAEDIKRQFVKSETRFYLTVGQIDCPTGKIVVADPLCYLAAGEFCPQLEKEIPPGTYPVEVSICRSDLVGIRMCTARMKIKDTEAVYYQCAIPSEETAAAKAVDGVLSGFPVEAGMMTICDAQVAKEYRDFLEAWQEANQGKNHYDDYFASFFAESEKALPAYQRQGGDFIEWTNPQTAHKMVMIASGFGDGFYQSYWGYDSEDNICELIVPMVNPDLFE